MSRNHFLRLALLMWICWSGLTVSINFLERSLLYSVRRLYLMTHSLQVGLLVSFVADWTNAYMFPCHSPVGCAVRIIISLPPSPQLSTLELRLSTWTQVDDPASPHVLINVAELSIACASVLLVISHRHIPALEPCYRDSRWWRYTSMPSAVIDTRVGRINLLFLFILEHAVA